MRLAQHNAGLSDFTARAKDWVIVFTEDFEDRLSAPSREQEIKRKKSRNYIEWIIAAKA